MMKFINNIDGNKLALFCSFFLAALAIGIIGAHLLWQDGTDALPEIQFLEAVVQTVLYAGFGVSSVHVVAGAWSQYKQRQVQASAPPAPPAPPEAS